MTIMMVTLMSPRALSMVVMYSSSSSSSYYYYYFIYHTN